MSAYIVSKDHISALVSFCNAKNVYVYYDGKKFDVTNLDAIGQILVNENYRSVNTRYSSNDAPFVYEFQYLQRHFTLIQIIKLCHCYNYQSCETEDYYESLAYAIVRGIESHAVRLLPGYEEAEWGL